MADEKRKTGIDIIGDAPWGMHFCQFYQTKEDLLSILVPYFKAGLENNEFCMWITSEPLTVNDAKDAMRKAVPDFDRFLNKGQIEIIPHDKWYLKDGIFELKRVFNAWLDRLNNALAKGYDGMRVTGNTGWLEKRDWQDFKDYEEEINRVVCGYKMLVICTYSLDKCGASDIMDVMVNHQFAIIKKEGRWSVVESSEQKKADEALREANAYLDNLFNYANAPIIVWDPQFRITRFNHAFESLTGRAAGEVLGKTLELLFPPVQVQRTMEIIQKTLKGERWQTVEIEILHRDGTVRTVLWNSATLFDSDGKTPIATIAQGQDITERKQAEMALWESRQRFQGLVETLYDWVWEVDPQGHYTYISPRIRDILGYEPEKLLGKTPFDLMPAEEAQRVSKIFGPLVAEQKPIIALENTNLHNKDGHPVIMETNGLPLYDAQGKFKGYRGTDRDITERKRAEESIKQSAEEWRNLFNSIPNYILVLDNDNIITKANFRFAEAYNISPEKLIGKKCYEFFHKSDKPCPGCPYELTKKDKLPHSAEIDDPNIKIPLLVTTAPIFNDKNEIIGAIHVAKDVSILKKAEEKLKISEENYRELFQNAPMGMYRTKIDGSGFMDFNDKLTEIFGYTREELLGTQPKMVWPDSATRDQMLKLLFKNGVLNNYESRVLTKSGEVKIVLASSKLYPDKGYLEGSVTDITERKKAEEELHQRREELFHMQRFKSMGELASSLAHEINQPLAGILSNAQAAQRFLTGTEPDLSQIREILADIVADDKRAGEIIHRLRALLRKEEAPRESMDINSAIRNVITLVNNEAIVRNVSLLSELAEELPQVYTDRIQIEQVILNLVLNAAQAMEDVTVHKRNIVISTVRDTPNRVVVSVRDTGPGIAKDKLEQVFEPFYTTKAKGLGMGLPICQSILAAHEGRIWAENNPDGGARFCFSLPAVEGNAESGSRKTYPSRKSEDLSKSEVGTWSAEE